MSRHPHTWAQIAALIALALVLFGFAGMCAAAGPPLATPATLTTPDSGGQAASTGTDTAATCSFGVDLISLHDLDMARGTFGADFWIWSVCPDNTYKPLSTMEFLDADSTQMSNVLYQVTDGKYWTQAKITGTFRHSWDLTKFPFGGQHMVIQMEESEALETEFSYVAEVADTVHEPNIEIDGWHVSDSHLVAGTHRYATNFGDPRYPVGMSDFSRLTLNVTLARRGQATSFFKFTFVVYIAFLISLISYFVNLGSATLLTARLGIISGTLFAIALNLQSGTSILNTEEALTLIDKIHVVALVAILIDAFAALISQRLMERNRSVAEVNRFNRLVMTAVLTGFAGANIVLIGLAALS